MQYAGSKEKESAGIDLWLALPVFLLTGLGVLLVYSSSSYLAEAKMGGSTVFFTRHLVRVGLGLVGFVGFAVTPVEFWRRNAKRIFTGVVVSLLLLFIAGQTVAGATRWLKLAAFSFQPSELARIALVLFLAALIAQKGETFREFRKGFLPVAGALFLVAGLVVLQPAVSTASLLLLCGVLIIYYGRAKLLHVALVVVVMAGLFFGAVKLFPHAAERMEMYSAPEDQYQVEQAKLGMAQGGLLGEGLGKGKEKFLYLPKPHTDFIYAVVGEELGFLGSMLVLGLFVVIGMRGLVLAKRLASDKYRGLLAFGSSSVIVVWGLAHSSVVVGLLPPTGLPMPFVSYGGSALLVNLCLAGLLVRLSRDASREEERWSL